MDKRTPADQGEQAVVNVDPVRCPNRAAPQVDLDTARGATLCLQLCGRRAHCPTAPVRGPGLAYTIITSPRFRYTLERLTTAGTPRRMTFAAAGKCSRQSLSIM